MQKYPLIGVSICSIILLILSTFTNVVGTQTIQPSNQKTTKEEINNKELLFQTILNIANNIEIQKIVFNSEMRREIIFNLDKRVSGFTPQVFTKNFLTTSYHLGLILSKSLKLPRIHSMLSRYHSHNLEIQREITFLKTKNDELNRELIQLSSLNCDCQKGLDATKWTFPVICAILLNLFVISALLNLQSLVELIFNLAQTIQCSWSPHISPV
jgi:hypothetical protein